MKLFLINIILLFCFAQSNAQKTTLNIIASDSTISSTHKHHKPTTFWQKLTPNQITTQYAGSIGLISAGLGWHYFNDKWETDILIGYIPKYISNENKFTFTLKQRFVPWNFKVGKQFSLNPLSVGLFLNTIFGENFWKEEPSKYPPSYYGFPTAMRLNIFLGQQLNFKIPTYNRNITMYYELSTCDLYIVSAFVNKKISITDILSLAIGIKLDIF